MTKKAQRRAQKCFAVTARPEPLYEIKYEGQLHSKWNEGRGSKADVKPKRDNPNDLRGRKRRPANDRAVRPALLPTEVK